MPGSASADQLFGNVGNCWDSGLPDTKFCVQELKGHRGWIADAVLAPSQASAITVASDTLAVVWDTKAGTCTNILEGHSGEVHSVVLTRKGRCGLPFPNFVTLLLAARPCSIYVWEYGIIASWMANTCLLARKVLCAVGFNMYIQLYMQLSFQDKASLKSKNLKACMLVDLR